MVTTPILRDGIIQLGRAQSRPDNLPPIGLSFSMSFAAANMEYSLDLAAINQSNIFGTPEALFISNAFNPSSVLITSLATGLSLSIPGQWSGTVKLDALGDSARLLFSSVGGATVGQANLTRVIVYNYEVPLNGWYESGSVVGTIDVDIISSITLPISAATLPLPTGAATSALQGTGNTSLANILLAVDTLEALQAAANALLTTIDADTSRIPAYGTAGAASADVISVQGVTGGAAIPTIGPRPFIVKGAIPNTAVTYTAGQCIGGLITIATGLPPGTILTATNFRFKARFVDLPAPISSLSLTTDIFDENPSASTYTDAVAAVLAAADTTKDISCLPNNAMGGLTGGIALINFTGPRMTVDAGGNVYVAIRTSASLTMAVADAFFYQFDGTY